VRLSTPVKKPRREALVLPSPTELSGTGERGGDEEVGGDKEEKGWGRMVTVGGGEKRKMVNKA